MRRSFANSEKQGQLWLPLECERIVKDTISQMLLIQCRPNYEKWVSGPHSLPPVNAVPPPGQSRQHHAASIIALCAHPAAPVHVQDAELAAGAQDRAQVCEAR